MKPRKSGSILAKSLALVTVSLMIVPPAAGATEATTSLHPPYASADERFDCNVIGTICEGSSTADADTGELDVRFKHLGAGVGLACFGVCIPIPCGGDIILVAAAVVGESNLSSPATSVRASVPVDLDAGEVRHLGCLPVGASLYLTLDALCGTTDEGDTVKPCSATSASPIWQGDGPLTELRDEKIPERQISLATELRPDQGQVILPGSVSARVELWTYAQGGTSRTEMLLSAAVPRIDLTTVAA